jgi:hypothetical protein
VRNPLVRRTITVDATLPTYGSIHQLDFWKLQRRAKHEKALRVSGTVLFEWRRTLGPPMDCLILCRRSCWLHDLLDSIPNSIRRIAASLADLFSNVTSAVTDLSGYIPSCVTDCSTRFFNVNTTRYKTGYDKYEKRFEAIANHCPSNLEWVDFRGTMITQLGNP